MKTLHTIFDKFQLSYPLEKILNPAEALFIDIETTGFSAKTSNLYLIGCAYYAEEKWQSIQWFAQKHEEESQIISAFFEFAYLEVSYDGENFEYVGRLNIGDLAFEPKGEVHAVRVIADGPSDAEPRVVLEPLSIE